MKSKKQKQVTVQKTKINILDTKNNLTDIELLEIAKKSLIKKEKSENSKRENHANNKM